MRVTRARAQPRARARMAQKAWQSLQKAKILRYYIAMMRGYDDKRM